MDATGTTTREGDARAALDLAAMNSFASASVLSFLYSAPVKPLTWASQSALVAVNDGRHVDFGAYQER